MKCFDFNRYRRCEGTRSPLLAENSLVDPCFAFVLLVLLTIPWKFPTNLASPRRPSPIKPSPIPSHQLNEPFLRFWLPFLLHRDSVTTARQKIPSLTLSSCLLCSSSSFLRCTIPWRIPMNLALSIALPIKSYHLIHPPTKKLKKKSPYAPCAPTSFSNYPMMHHPYFLDLSWTQRIGSENFTQANEMDGQDKIIQ